MITVMARSQTAESINPLIMNSTDESMKRFFESIDRKKNEFRGFVEDNGHELLCEYINESIKVLIDFKCGHEYHFITPHHYRNGHGCPECGAEVLKIKAKEDLMEKITVNNHKLLSEYSGTKEKVLINFNCGHEPHWTAPENYKKGRGCPKCADKKEPARKGLIELAKKNGHVLLSDYKDTKTKVLIDFQCGHAPHYITPNCYKNGRGCPECAKKNSGKKTNEKAKKDLIEMINQKEHGLLSEYVNSNIKVLIDFKCRHEPHWIAPNNYKNGQGCPKCAGKCPAQAKQDFILLVHQNRHSLASEYKNRKTKVAIDFGCGHKPHFVRPNEYKKGAGCPECWRIFNKERLTKYGIERNEKAKKDFINLLNKNGHQLKSDYINVTTKVFIEYHCGHEPHWITPKSYKSGAGCPKCGRANRANILTNKTKKEFMHLIDRNGHKLLSEYSDDVTKVYIDYQCGHEPHYITPNYYKKRKGCPKCTNTRSKQAEKDFMDLLQKNEHILLCNYVKNNEKVLIDFCCSHEPHWITPKHYKRDVGCPVCAKNRKRKLDVDK